MQHCLSGSLVKVVDNSDDEPVVEIYDHDRRCRRFKRGTGEKVRKLTVKKYASEAAADEEHKDAVEQFKQRLFHTRAAEKSDNRQRERADAASCAGGSSQSQAQSERAAGSASSGSGKMTHEDAERIRLTARARGAPYAATTVKGALDADAATVKCAPEAPAASASTRSSRSVYGLGGRPLDVTDSVFGDGDEDEDDEDADGVGETAEEQQ